MPFDYDGPGDFGSCTTCGRDYDNQYQADEYFCLLCEGRANGDICQFCTSATVTGEFLCKKCLDEDARRRCDDEVDESFSEIFAELLVFKENWEEQIKKEKEKLQDNKSERSLGIILGLNIALEAVSHLIEEYTFTEDDIEDDEE